MSNPAYKTADYMTVEAYQQLERSSDIKHEYVDGWVYAMVRASDRHNLLAGFLYASLFNALPDRCQVFIADMQVHIKRGLQEYYYYPDIVVSCDMSDRKTYQREKPKLIVEVLSPSTARLDRREKFADYRQLESLEEYVLVSQDQRLVEIHRRVPVSQSEELDMPEDWQHEIFKTGELTLASVDLTFTMDDLYRRVTFEEKGE